jgi:hypothetical protein
MKVLLPATAEYNEEIINFTPSPDKKVKEVITRSRQGAAYTKKIEVVCEECNSAWMNRLDTRARSFVGPMIKGQFVALNELARIWLAKWVTLKVLVLEQERPIGTPASPIHPQSALVDFKDAQLIPSGIRIWIGHGGGPQWQTRMSRWSGGISLIEGESLPADFRPPVGARNIESVTWGVGHLRLFAIGTTDLDVHNRLVYDMGSMIPLWPIGKTDIVWPPSFDTTDATMFNLMTFLTELTAKGPVILRPAHNGLSSGTTPGSIEPVV